MHYIRFLKTPRIHVDGTTVQLKAVITITTDLGETFYRDPLDLVATLASPPHDASDDGPEIFLRRRLAWPGHPTRALPLSLDLSRQDVDWPACVHIAPRGSSPSSGCDGFLPPIVDIWSGNLNPTKGHFSSGRRVERRFHPISYPSRPCALLEDAGDSIARHLWDGSQALAQHLDATLSLQLPSSPLPLLEYVLVSATYRRLTAIELGCGCGAVGIALAQTIPDADVLLTDLPDARELVEENISRMRPAINARVHFAELDWEDETPPLWLAQRVNDMIIVSECTYNPSTFPALVRTLAALVARSPQAVIVIATKTRHAGEAEFWGLMAREGFVEEGVMRLSLPGSPGTGYADSAGDVGVHIWKGKEHRLTLSPKGGE
ncbi:hypothetical protein M433DRAFT_76 [Acidomyces richmondensis BFW]|nr:hypothetical protein M433DRAFT_76 [Acidomyces richmondensis BFW]